MSFKQTAKLLAPMWLVTITVAAFAAPQNPGATLTNIAQIRALSDADMEQQPEARFEAVVSLHVPSRSYLWVQDEHDGLMVYVKSKRFSVQPGDRVLVTGHVVHGENGALLAPDDVKVLSSGKVPNALSRTAAELSTFDDLNKRVQVQGRIVQCVDKPSRLTIELEDSTNHFWVELPRQTNTSVHVVENATVQARGICIRRVFEFGETALPTVLVQGVDDLDVLKRGETKTKADPEGTPLVAISSLTRDIAAGQGNVTVRIRGTVLDQRLGESLIVRDNSGTISVESPDMVMVPVQESVDVWGTPTWNGTRLFLRDATFRLSGSNASRPATTESTAQKPAELPTLTKASQVLGLSADQAAWKYPIKLRGVVTLYYPQRRQFFVQDDTAGFYVLGPWNRTDLTVGDLVEVTGVTDPGTFAPMIQPKDVVSLGTATLPVARKATLFQMASGQYDSQWIEARGVVRSFTSMETNLWRLKVAAQDGTLYVYVPSKVAPEKLIDSVIRLRGVCTTHPNQRRQITSLVLWSPSLDYINVEEPGATNITDLPLNTIASLNRFQPVDALQRRVKVSGVVTLMQSSKSLFIQDGLDGIMIELNSAVDALKQGDHVVAAGYPSSDDYGYALRESVVEVVQSGKALAAQPLPLDFALNPPLHDTLVETEGRLIYHARTEHRETLTLQAGDAIFDAACLKPDPSRKLPPIGSLLRVTGVYRILPDETRAPSSFRIVVPSWGSIVLMAQPSWWSLKHTTAVVGGLTFVTIVTVLWVMLLRRRVQEQTKILQQSESKFRTLVEQSLVGVYIIQDGRYAYVNPRQGEIFGYTAQEMLTLKFEDTVFPEDLSMVQDQLRRRLAGENLSGHFTFRGKRKDGSIVHIEVLGNQTQFHGKPAVGGSAMDITERKRAEEQLSSSRQMLRTVLDNIPQRVFWKDRNSVYVGCNKPFAQDCGYSDPAEVTGKTDYETSSAETAALSCADDRHVMETGVPRVDYEQPHHLPDGRQGWLRTSKVPLFDVNGQVIGVLGTYEDITDRKQAEAAFAEASNLLEMMLENAPDYIYFKDQQSRFVRSSKSLARMFRAPNEKFLIGKTDFDFFLEEHARQAFEDEQQIIRTGQPIIGKPEKETHTDGRTTWALTTKLPWFDKDGKIVGTFGISKDVTAIKEAEMKLEYERQLFHALVDQFPDNIYFKDRESRFLRLSRSKVERSRSILLARHHEQNPDGDTSKIPLYLTDAEKFAHWIVGKTDFDVSPEAAARVSYDDEQRIIATGQPIIAKLEQQAALGGGKPTWVLATKMPWRDQNGNIVGTFGVSRDVTAIKEAEAQLESAHQRLVETSRLAGMAEVATDVLHNVGNVLNSVNVSCSLTIDRLRSSKMGSLGKVSSLLHENRSNLAQFLTTDSRGQQIPDYLKALATHLSEDQTTLLKELEQLLRHVDHIKQIVAMQQSYAKVAGVKESVSPMQLIDDALHINAAALTRHDVHVAKDFENVPPIMTEKHKVLQILVNLIRNAKYALDDSKRSDKLLTLKVGPEGSDHLKIQVVDNGIGIPRENLTRIFGHGFTTRRNGHGFGLHSSALAVRELGGSLHADSGGEGQGATFTLLLPYKASQPEPAK